ncbi:MULTISPECIES: single-stranded DNA-binding protein [unclassified Polaromonas]|uniref:single-stranded DNA-binding protein n=1 Tax=unclassified Polaromonas TaxID=2638319 RepID=UPI0018C9B6B9|nr:MULTISPECIES: single-stranded DNA-binding protein [unclassified Polaromonas]MBG6073437.1 single-strand DNA-binding protein [Polaromonas sp. CG_9.7]MBG6115378.1 single-strand DNA-binding protein [Polaromonas sp. CG_9.2]
MASVNKIILIGQVVESPQVRSLNDGSTVCNLTLVTSESWEDKVNRDKRTRTERHRVVLYRQLADIAGRYLVPGSQVYIEGRLKTRSWQDQQSQTRYVTEVEAISMTMLGSKANSSQDTRPPTGVAKKIQLSERDPWENAPEGDYPSPPISQAGIVDPDPCPF